jgi:hypothetical protein
LTPESDKIKALEIRKGSVYWKDVVSKMEEIVSETKRKIEAQYSEAEAIPKRFKDEIAVLEEKVLKAKFFLDEVLKVEKERNLQKIIDAAKVKYQNVQKK